MTDNDNKDETVHYTYPELELSEVNMLMSQTHALIEAGKADTATFSPDIVMGLLSNLHAALDFKVQHENENDSGMVIRLKEAQTPKDMALMNYSIVLVNYIAKDGEEGFFLATSGVASSLNMLGMLHQAAYEVSRSSINDSSEGNDG